MDAYVEVLQARGDYRRFFADDIEVEIVHRTADLHAMSELLSQISAAVDVEATQATR